MKDIRIEGVHGHYEIYVDGEFYCSCDSASEVIEEIERIENG